MGSHLKMFGVLLATVLVLSSTGVQGQPILEEFTLNMTPPEELILTFDAAVDPLTCNAAALTIHGTSTPQPESTAFFESITCTSAGGFAISVQPMDWNSLQGNIEIATSAANTFISLDPGFVQTSGGIDSAAVTGLQVSMFTPNSNPPVIVQVGLFFDEGSIGLVFTEAVSIQPVDINPTGITIHYSDRISNAPSSFTLSGMTNISLLQEGVGALIRVGLTPNDRNNLKLNGGQPYSIDIDAGTFIDGNGMGNNAVSGMSFTFVLPDMTPPNLLQFDLDLNVGNILLSFDEPMSMDNANLAFVTVLGSQDPTGNGTTLDASQIISVANFSTILTIQVERSTLNVIKLNRDICYNASNCFIFAEEFSFADISGNSINSSLGDIIPVGVFTPDMTPVQLVSYIIDLNSGVMTLEFSEPIDEFSFNPQGIEFRDSNGMNPQNIGNSVITSLTESNTFAVVAVENVALNSAKLFQQGGGVLLTVMSTAVFDTFGNPITAITTASPLSPTAVEPDLTGPSLLSFEVSSLEQAQLSLSFSEVVSASSLVVTDIVITFVSPLLVDTMYTLKGGTVVTSDSDVLVLQFIQADLNSFSTQYNESFNGGSFMLTAGPTLATDIFGNAFQQPVQPLSFSNIPQIVLGFDLDLDAGVVIISFTEPIDSSMIVFSDIYLAGVLMTEPTGYNLAGGSLVSFGINMTMVTLAMTQSTLNQIKFDPTTCTDIPDCFMFIGQGAFRDDMGDQLLSGPVRLLISGMIPDLTSPDIVEYTIDLDTGLLTFSFSEPINSATLAPEYFTLYNMDMSRSTMLTGAVAFSVSDLNTQLTLEMRESLNLVKVVAMNSPSLSLTANESAIMDTTGNQLNSIPLGSAFQPSQLTVDTTPPLMVDFIARPPESMSLMMVFDEYVVPSEIDSSKLILTFNTRDGITMYGPGNFTMDTAGSVISDRVTFMFSASTFTAQFQQEYTEAFYSGFIALTTQTGFITDTNANQLQAITDPLLSNNDSVIPDLTRPTLVSFDFDLDAGQLIMTFSENVTVLTTTGQVTMQDAPGPLNVLQFYTFQQEGIVMTNNEVVTLTLSMVDLNAIKTNVGLGTGAFNTFLRLNSSFAEDLSGNLLEANEVPIQVSSFISDTQGPQIISTTFDLNTGVLNFNLDEPVSTVLITQISFTSMVQSTTGSVVADGMLVNTDVTLTIMLSPDTLNSIKSMSELCTQGSNCYLFVSSSAFTDYNGNQVAAPSMSFQAAMFIPDTTQPELVSFNLDLTSGQLAMTFSEAVSESSLDVSQIFLQNTAGDFIILDSASVSNIHGFDTVIVLLLPFDSLALNRAKLYGVEGAANVFMFLTSATVSDTNANMIIPISSSNALLVNTLIGDTRHPTMLAFSPRVPAENLLTFHFDEYVNSSTWDGMAITLTLITPESAFVYNDFIAGTLTPPISDTIQYRFGGDMLSEPFTTQYMRAYERGSILLTRGTNLIQDIAGNGLNGFTLFNYTNITRESVRPEIISFTFSSISGELAMTFTEPIIVSTAVGTVTLQNLPSIPQVVHTLTEDGTMSTDMNVVTVVLGSNDLSNIRSNPDLGTTVDNTYLRLDPGFGVDMIENPILGQSNGLQATSVEAPDEATGLISFDLDMNLGLLVLSFNNVIDISTVAAPMLTIQNSRISNAVAFSPSTISAPNSVMDMSTVAIQLFINDQNALKTILDLATMQENTYLSFFPSLARDVHGNQVVGILSNNSIRVNNFIPDTTPPQVARFQLDLNSGLIDLLFNEPIDASSIQVISFVIQNTLTPSSATVSLTLTGGDIAVTTSTPTLVDITMTQDDLNAIKTITDLATSMDDSYLNLGSNAVADTAQNNIGGQVVQAVTYQGDIAVPTLQYFDLDLRDGVNAVMTMQFNEPIVLDAATTLPGITLQDSQISPSSSLILSTMDSLTRPSLDMLIITLRSDYANMIISGENIGGSGDQLYLSLASNAIIDFSGNPVPGIPVNAAMRVRYIYRTCVGDSYLDLSAGACINCSSVCVDSCSGDLPIPGDGGCDMCHVLLLQSNRSVDQCIDQTSGCPQGYYDVTSTSPLTNLATIVCQPCSTECFTCTSAAVCQSCTTAFGVGISPIRCLPSCDSSDTSCGTCHSQCDGCTGTGNTNCLQCKEARMVSGNTITCIPQCTSDQFLNQGPSGDYSCIDCHPDCNGCRGSTQADCTECRSVHEFRQGLRVCLANCPDNSYRTSTDECIPCDSRCNGCTGTTIFDCLGCEDRSASALIGGQTACVTGCPAGQTNDPTTGDCITDQTTVIIAAVVGVIAGILIITVVIVLIVTCIYCYKTRGFFNPNKDDDGPVLFIDAKLTESNIPVEDSNL